MHSVPHEPGAPKSVIGDDIQGSQSGLRCNSMHCLLEHIHQLDLNDPRIDHCLASLSSGTAVAVASGRHKNLPSLPAELC